jgi:hypothetical protein
MILSSRRDLSNRIRTLLENSRANERASSSVARTTSIVTCNLAGSDTSAACSQLPASVRQPPHSTPLTNTMSCFAAAPASTGARREESLGRLRLPGGLAILAAAPAPQTPIATRSYLSKRLGRIDREYPPCRQRRRSAAGQQQQRACSRKNQWSSRGQSV